MGWVDGHVASKAFSAQWWTHVTPYLADKQDTSSDFFSCSMLGSRWSCVHETVLEQNKNIENDFKQRKAANHQTWKAGASDQIFCLIYNIWSNIKILMIYFFPFQHYFREILSPSYLTSSPHPSDFYKNIWPHPPLIHNSLNWIYDAEENASSVSVGESCSVSPHCRSHSAMLLPF